MKSIEAAWRRISKADDGLEQLCCMVNDNIRLQVGGVGGEGRALVLWRNVFVAFVIIT